MWVRKLSSVVLLVATLLSVAVIHTGCPDEPTVVRPNKPSYIAPDSASSVIGPDVTIVWHSATNDDGEALLYEVDYNIFDYSTNQWSSSNLSLDHDTTCELLELGGYDTVYWKVWAVESDENKTAGPTWFFVVAGDGIPTNPIPGDGWTGVSIEADLSWEYSGTPSDVIYCDVYFGTTSEPTLVSDNQTGTTYDPGGLNYETTYYWKIVSFTSATDSIVGPLWEFSTIGVVEIPQNPSPADGALSVSNEAVLSWDYSGTPSDVMYCDVYLGTTTDPGLVSNNQTGTTYDPGVLDYQTTYYWKIVSFTSASDSIVGQMWEFSTVEEEVFEVPQNPFPGDGWTSVSLEADLSWEYSGTPSDVIYCDVYFGTTPDPDLVSDNQTGTTFDPGGLDYQTKYYWKIVSFTSASDSIVGPVWEFTTIQLTESPINPIPGDGWTSVSTEADLSWEYSGTPGDVIYCDVYFGTTSDPSLVSNDQSGTTYDPGGLNYETTYYWKIVSFTSATDSIAGPLWEFTTIGVAEVPQNPSPADGALSVSTEAVLSWDYSGTPSDVIYCDVYLGTTTNPGLVSNNQTGTTYDPGVLDYQTTYYWKIVSFTSASDSIVGPLWSFNTEALVSQEIYAKFEFTSLAFDAFLAIEEVTARFDSSHAPDGPIIPLQADAITINGSPMYWSSFESEYHYFEESSMRWLVNGGTYNFAVVANAQVPGMTLETTYLECSPMITYPTSSDVIYLTGYTTQWDGICEGNVILTFLYNANDTADVWIETANDGEYVFTAEDLAPLEGFTGVITQVIILEERYYINETGYMSSSEVIMRATHSVTTTME